MADKSGTYDLAGLLFPVNASAASNQNATGPVVFNLIGVADTFNLASAAGSTVLVTQAVSVIDTVNLTTNGGAIQIGAGVVQALDMMSLDITGGGSVSLASSSGATGTAFLALLNKGSIAYGAGGGTLTLGTAGVSGSMTETSPIKGFLAPADMINDQSLNFADILGYTVTGAGTGTQTVTISDSAGTFLFETSKAGLANGLYAAGSGPLHLTADGSGGTLIGAVCFLAGTHLATPDGEARVEALAVGDLVAVREAGRTVHRPVTWIGRRAVDPARAGAGAVPVRIRAHAFAQGAPHRDLLVTQEHCVHVDGRLIPARMLVNGASVVLDAAVGAYEFFHVELERHAILVSEGLETESYLDTGNRANFANADVPALKPGFAVDPAASAWAERAAAPLAVDRATVEPVWARLAERAGALGLAAPDPGAPMTCEPDLRVVTDAGVEIRPSLADGRSYAFVIPGGARSLRLVSRAARPSETVGPFVDDRRRLGVLVGKVGLGVGRRRATTEAAAFGDLPGWHAREDGAIGRWTDGDALLPLDAWAWGEAPAFLDVEVINAGPYTLAREAALAA